ncbi:MAG: protein-disulfide reductase DsbD N-terminal domain-containing protein, partial [Sphaerotilus sp.]|nr:protein-disulfide reductase DsbD N-terminal domain-containing protein [Sphaerotilus sp.]
MKMNCFSGSDVRRLVWRCLAAVLVWLVVTGPVRAAETFLEPEQAFRLSVRVVDAQTLALRFEVAPGYYLYRERFEVLPGGPDVVLSPPVYPAGVVKFDETFQKEV